MLKHYLPHYLDNIKREQAARYAIEGIIHDSDAQSHKLTKARKDEITAYTCEKHPPALSAPSIIKFVDWYALPENHPLYPSRDGSGFAPEDWRLIGKYADIRGTAAHIRQAAESPEESSRRIHEETAELKRIDKFEQMYTAVRDWSGTVEMMPLDALRSLGDDPTEHLIDRCKDESLHISENWHQAAQHHSVHPILSEARLIVKIDGVLYCACPDQIAYVTDSPRLPPAMYSIDGKAVERIQPEHIAQAEAQRRAVETRVADDEPVHAILIRLGVGRDDWDIHSSTSDDWMGDEAWQIFKQKAEVLYDDGRVQADMGLID